MTMWLNENEITRYSTHGKHKAAIVKRFNGTLKTSMWKRFIAENTRNWIGMIYKLVNEYNNIKHSTMKMTPVEASKKKKRKLFSKIQNN